MKKLFFTLGVLVLSLTFASCSSDDDDKTIEYGQLPTQAQTFLAQYFSGNSGVERVVEDNDGYEVYYNNYKVEFYRDGEWEGVDGNHKRQNNALPPSIIELLPAGIAVYVTANYPTNTIVEVDKEKSYNTLVGYEIQLNSGLELDFSADGTFLRID